MLDELETINAAILVAADEVEAMLKRPTMPGEFVSVRWRFSQISSRRSRYMNDVVYPSLQKDMRPAVVEYAKGSQAALIATYTDSAKHIGRWSPQQIEENWSKYSSDVRTMLASIRERIGTEQKELYPFIRTHRPG